ncbi:hypothetical protein F9L33_12215 [Amylibacter sp. SFDW26]|uniref:hypothetical protein n=1 Tax=Amylibacter sp. SFDW26 TaxID=2652722 RepID=UPI0012627C00|nr:hypothetical protein [Amylibacter sp. SFDW26]KAB7613360.1 hypothetical protein F9L33_12215 [Amylibacter sp. SFDW26]
MMIFPKSSGMQTVYFTQKTKPHVVDFLIEEKFIDADDPLIPIIAAFARQENVNEIRIRNRIQLLFH